VPDYREFKLPDVGEGLVEAEIVTWKVKPGDEVKVNDIVVEIETAKSLVELPTPFAGVVSGLLVAEGDTIAVGTPFFVVDVDPDGAPAAAVAPPGGPSAESIAEVGMPAEGEPVEPGLIGGPAPGGRTSVLVGYGPRESTGKRRARSTDSAAVQAERSADVAQDAVQVAMTPEPTPLAAPPAAELPTALPSVTESEPTAHVTVLAKPPVRKLAKDLSVDLATVRATGAGGVITRADVEAAASGGVEAEATSSTCEASVTWLRQPGERETRIPIKGVRKMTAQAMVGSAFSAPHVTEFLTIDATRTVKLVERLKAHREFKDARLSPLLVLARAMIIAIRRTPEINSTWDEAAQEIVQKSYVNLGIAAATPRGLVVPNIKDADQMSLRELADALGELVATARAGKTQPAQMQQGTITITNVGVFGIDTGTPIINPGESAIVAFGAIREQPWVVNGRVRPRMVTTLAVSFDHRVVDGAGGSQFLADVGAIMEDPAIALALG
jgi:2-oxoisovalerate dehydrogenase E2 component (dihydrolipoyl transacylase)